MRIHPSFLVPALTISLAPPYLTIYFLPELARVRHAPSDGELAQMLSVASEEETTLLNSLSPLRAGAPALSTEELKALDQSWEKWRSEWVRRRKVFTT
jgi:26S proteasome regulatory subunit, ATPase 3, interacting protein